MLQLALINVLLAAQSWFVVNSLHLNMHGSTEEGEHISQQSDTNSDDSLPFCPYVGDPDKTLCMTTKGTCDNKCITTLARIAYLFQKESDEPIDEYDNTNRNDALCRTTITTPFNGHVRRPCYRTSSDDVRCRDFSTNMSTTQDGASMSYPGCPGVAKQIGEVLKYEIKPMKSGSLYPTIYIKGQRDSSNFGCTMSAYGPKDCAGSLPGQDEWCDVDPDSTAGECTPEAVAAAENIHQCFGGCQCAPRIYGQQGQTCSSVLDRVCGRFEPLVWVPCLNADPTTTTSSPHMTGDPHCTNLAGKSFDIFSTGEFTAIRYPIRAREDTASLLVHVTVDKLGAGCTKMYITKVNITGSWLPDRVDLRVAQVSKPGPEHAHLQDSKRPLNAVGIEILRNGHWEAMNEDNHISVENNELSVVKTHQPRKFPQVAVNVQGVEITVWARTRQHSIRFLNLNLKHFKDLPHEVGGILGIDDYVPQGTSECDTREHSVDLFNSKSDQEIFLSTAVIT